MLGEGKNTNGGLLLVGSVGNPGFSCVDDGAGGRRCLSVRLPVCVAVSVVGEREEGTWTAHWASTGAGLRTASPQPPKIWTVPTRH